MGIRGVSGHGRLLLVAAACWGLVGAVSSGAAEGQSLQDAAASSVTQPFAGVSTPGPGPLELAPALGGVNILVTGAANAQNETTIAINPNSPANLIGGANDYRNGPPNCGVYSSSDNGNTWTGATLPQVAGFTDAGDPGVAFDPDGHAYFLCLNFNRDSMGRGIQLTQYIRKSSDGGLTWSAPVLAAGAFQANKDDKGHIAVDNGPSSPFRGNIYVSFTRLNTGEIRFNRSTNGGASFAGCVPGPCADFAISNSNPGVVQGSNIAVGIDGAVYVAWADNNNGSTSRIVIDKSTNGGQMFGALSGGTNHVVRTFTAIGNPDLSRSVRPLSRANSFPVIATSPTDANVVYAVWAEKPAGTDDSDIMLARSADGGNTWSSPIRVNDDINPLGDFNSQFFPWMAVDPTDGSINIAWFDDRDDPNHTDGTPLVNDYFASSTDGGLTFSKNLRVSTQSSNTNANFGSGSNQFFGDYNAVAARNGVA